MLQPSALSPPRHHQREARVRLPARCASLLVLLLSLATLPSGLVGCGARAGRELHDEVITVACGNCIFHMKNAKNCPWAALVDGQHYLITGPVPPDHNSHAPDGICNMTRKARVTGQIRGEYLVASSFQLLPVDPAEVPKNPKYTPADIH